jgi:hypothetical protein
MTSARDEKAIHNQALIELLILLMHRRPMLQLVVAQFWLRHN